MPKDDSFYLIEETIELIRGIERNLELHKLDPETGLDLEDLETRKRVTALIANLDAILSAKERDPRLLRLVVQVKGLREFLQVLQKALSGSASYAKWLQKQKGINTKKRLTGQLTGLLQGLTNGWVLPRKKSTPTGKALQKTSTLKPFLRQLLPIISTLWCRS